VIFAEKLVAALYIL